MPLIQITDVFNEPLDLWLSPNHEGQRRYIRVDDLVPAQTGELLGYAEHTGMDPRIPALLEQQRKQQTAAMDEGRAREGVACEDGDGDGDGDGDVVLCSFIPEEEGDALGSKGPSSSAQVPWLQPGRGTMVGDKAGRGVSVAAGGAGLTDGETDEAMVERVPAPPPVGLMAAVKPIPTVLPHPDKKNPVQLAEEARVFSSEAGVPTVFVTKPPPNVVCRVCKDVYLDPRIANDGFTYCRKCVPNLGDLDVVDGYEFDKEDLVRDHEVWEKILALQILCKNGLTFQDVADGMNKWVYNSEGCSEAVTFEGRVTHERTCGFARARCGLPRGKNDNDSCPLMIYRYERQEHQAQCPYRLTECSVIGCGKRVQFNRRAQHASLCEFKMTECPNGCPWKGRRSELVQHKKKCELELVTCGREDTEVGWVRPGSHRPVNARIPNPLSDAARACTHDVAILA